MHTIIKNIVCICLLFLLIKNNHALRCRSGNQEINDEAEKVMLKCKRHHSDSDKNDSDSSSADMSSEEDSSLSDSSIFNKEFFASPKKELQNSMENSENVSSSRGNGHELYRKQSAIQPSYMTPLNDTKMRENQHRMSNGNRDNGFMMNRSQHDNQRTSDADLRGKSCSAQCFFDEFNSVNQRGFPERTPVTRMILRGIQDPTLRDFIEQSILECFQFLDSGMKNDKCTFSQNLLDCLADKGREHCEDWNN